MLKEVLDHAQKASNTEAPVVTSGKSSTGVEFLIIPSLKSPQESPDQDPSPSPPALNTTVLPDIPGTSGKQRWAYWPQATASPQSPVQPTVTRIVSFQDIMADVIGNKRTTYNDPEAIASLDTEQQKKLQDALRANSQNGLQDSDDEDPDDDDTPVPVDVSPGEAAKDVAITGGLFGRFARVRFRKGEDKKAKEERKLKEEEEKRLKAEKDKKLKEAAKDKKLKTTKPGEEDRRPKTGQTDERGNDHAGNQPDRKPTENRSGDSADRNPVNDRADKANGTHAENRVGRSDRASVDHPTDPHPTSTAKDAAAERRIGVDKPAGAKPEIPGVTNSAEKIASDIARAKTAQTLEDAADAGRGLGIGLGSVKTIGLGVGAAAGALAATAGATLILAAEITVAVGAVAGVAMYAAGRYVGKTPEEALNMTAKGEEMLNVTPQVEDATTKAKAALDAGNYLTAAGQGARALLEVTGLAQTGRDATRLVKYVAQNPNEAAQKTVNFIKTAWNGSGKAIDNVKADVKLVYEHPKEFTDTAAHAIVAAVDGQNPIEIASGTMATARQNGLASDIMTEVKRRQAVAAGTQSPAVQVASTDTARLPPSPSPLSGARGKMPTDDELAVAPPSRHDPNLPTPAAPQPTADS